MRKIRAVLRLYFAAALSIRAIARSLGTSPSTVGDYLRRAKVAGLSWPVPESVDDTGLERRLFPAPPSSRTERPLPDWSEVHRELRRKSVTLSLLWQEYKETHPEGLQYSWFCDQYRAWAGKLDLVMRQDHRAGDGVGCDELGSHEARAFVDGGATASNNRAYKHSVLTGFYRYAIARGLATRSPLPVTAPKTFPRALPYIYSREELRRLLDATKTYRKRVNQLEPHTFRTLLLVLYGAGLRRGEALNLTLADVDLQAALLTVRETKFDKTRFVPLGPQLARAMEEYAAQRQASGASRTGEAPFFVNRDGTPLAARTVSKAFVHLRRAAGVSREAGARARRRTSGSVVHSIMNSERSMRPTSRRAAASSFWRGYAASLRRSWLGRMVPAAMVAATRRMSAQFRSIRSTFTLPPTSGRRCFGTPARSNT